ncbi:MAG: hypothetical protein ACI93R_001194 [Flavobacteriales bacterium]|jgi:hypothetical protein
MSLISPSHVSLVRARRAMEKAFSSEQWDQLKALDRELGASLDMAFTDEERDTKTLVSELEKVLSIYASIVDTLPESSVRKVLSPAKK